MSQHRKTPGPYPSTSWAGLHLFGLLALRLVDVHWVLRPPLGRFWVQPLHQRSGEGREGQGPQPGGSGICTAPGNRNSPRRGFAEYSLNLLGATHETLAIYKSSWRRAKLCHGDVHVDRRITRMPGTAQIVARWRKTIRGVPDHPVVSLLPSPTPINGTGRRHLGFSLPNSRAVPAVHAIAKAIKLAVDVLVVGKGASTAGSTSRTISQSGSATTTFWASSSHYGCSFFSVVTPSTVASAPSARQAPVQSEDTIKLPLLTHLATCQCPTVHLRPLSMSTFST